MHVQRRFFSRILSWNFRNVRSKNDSIAVNLENKGNREQLIIPFVWLRDHCTSEKLYHLPTNQRKSKCTDLLEKARIDREEQIGVSGEQKCLKIEWNDGHLSVFDIGELAKKAVKKQNVGNQIGNLRQLWNSHLETIPKISSTSLTLESFSEKLVKYGVVIVEDVEKTPEATEKLCKSLVPVHDTFFGQFWVFSNSASQDEPVYEDTAYGNEDIGPHTDGTYFNQTPGIQVFHCLQPAKTGGDTVLVDSFYCAQKLRNEDPEAFEVLCNTKIAHHYLEGTPPGSAIHSVSLEKPVIEVDSFGNIVQIRFNPYDRAPFNCLSSVESGASEAIQFYESYEKLSNLIHNADNSVHIGLRPGSVIFIDNFRVLHSRTGFQGYRKMCGCYLSRDNFYAKARPFLPENIRELV